jgi:diaminopimelate decarboxylase
MECGTMPRKRNNEEGAALVEAAERMRIDAIGISVHIGRFLMKGDPLRKEAEEMVKLVSDFSRRLSDEFPS